MKNLVFLVLAVFAMSACDQKGSNSKGEGAAQPESHTCGVQPEKAGTTEELVADAYRLKSCGFTEDNAVLLLK